MSDSKGAGKRWSEAVWYAGKRFEFGFIDEGGEKYGDRHYLIIEGIVAPINIADVLVPVLKGLFKKRGFTMKSEQALCELCGEPMPEGEEMFKYHGYSGPCPKPPQERQTNE